MNPFGANSECDVFSNFTFHWWEYEGGKCLSEREREEFTKYMTITKISPTMAWSKGNFVFSWVQVFGLLLH